MPTSLFTRYTSRAIVFTTIFTGLLLINGCQNKQQSRSNYGTVQEKEINQLRLRINKLESQIVSLSKNPQVEDLQSPSGPIKSITFRLGTKDDRLRIYWGDGRNSDLPCTKEHSIWVCG